MVEALGSSAAVISGSGKDLFHGEILWNLRRLRYLCPIWDMKKNMTRPTGECPSKMMHNVEDKPFHCSRDLI